MTYNELLQELNDQQEKSRMVYIKLKNEIENLRGFADIYLLKKFTQAEKQWQSDQNKFLEMRGYVRDQNINLDATM